jgi:hypothetical protein
MHKTSHQRRLHYYCYSIFALTDWKWHSINIQNSQSKKSITQLLHLVTVQKRLTTRHSEIVECSVKVRILLEAKIENVKNWSLFSLLDACCMDHIKNGDETDIDCGGIKCPKCEDMKTCKADCDCISDVCKNNRCVRKYLIFVFKNFKLSNCSCCIMWR